MAASFGSHLPLSMCIYLSDCFGARPEKYESRGKPWFNTSAMLVNGEMVCFLQLVFELFLIILNVSNLFLMTV